MSSNKISSMQAIALVLIVIVNHLVLTITNNITSSTGSASLLNSIYVFIFALLLVWLIVKLYKNFTGKDILDISQFLGGKILKTIVGILYLVYFIFILSLVVRRFAKDMKLIYFNDFEIGTIIFLILFISVIAYHFGHSSITKCNLIIVPIMVIFILIAAFANIDKFKFERVFPILGFGVNETFFIGLSNIFAYSGIGILYLIMPMLKDTKDFKKISYISVIVTGLLIILSIGSLLLAFPFIKSISEISELYIGIRHISFGNVFQRVDAIFILGWILAVISYSSVLIMFIVLLFSKLTNSKRATPVAMVFAAIAYSLSLIPPNANIVSSIDTVVYKYGSIALIIVGSLLILIFANIKYKSLNKNKVDGDLNET